MPFQAFQMDDVVDGFALTDESYPVIGTRIAALGRPTLIVQERGYALDTLGEHVVGLLRDFER